MPSGPFRVVWEICDDDEWDSPTAEWERAEEIFDQERDAIGLWRFLKGYTHTRPISIDPEPDWSSYIYDSMTPLKKKEST